MFRNIGKRGIIGMTYRPEKTKKDEIIIIPEPVKKLDIKKEILVPKKRIKYPYIKI